MGASRRLKTVDHHISVIAFAGSARRRSGAIRTREARCAPDRMGSQVLGRRHAAHDPDLAGSDLAAGRCAVAVVHVWRRVHRRTEGDRRGATAVGRGHCELGGEHHAVPSGPLNTLFALLQIWIGVGLLNRRTVKLALAASLAWSLLVWWFGEGFGMLFMSMSKPLSGAPGAAILSLMVALAVWPGTPPGGLLGVRGAKVVGERFGWSWHGCGSGQPAAAPMP